MDEHVGILLCLRASVIDRLGCAAVFAFTVFPSVGTIGVQDVAAFGVEPGNAVFAVGVLATVNGTAGQVGCQLRDGDAEDLVVQDMVDAELPVRHQGFKAPVEALDDFPEEDAALGERIQKLGVRTLEKVLRQQIQDAVSKLRRGEDFVVAQVGDSIEHVRIVITVHHRQQHLS